jgi:hypothetical protein
MASIKFCDGIHTETKDFEGCGSILITSPNMKNMICKNCSLKYPIYEDDLVIININNTNNSIDRLKMYHLLRWVAFDRVGVNQKKKCINPNCNIGYKVVSRNEMLMPIYSCMCGAEF